MKENLPEGFWRLLILGFIIYFFIIVGKVVSDNYQANKQIDDQKQDIVDLKNQISDLQLHIFITIINQGVGSIYFILFKQIFSLNLITD